MAKKHPSDTAKIVYRIKPVSVWRAIRAEWEAGAIPVDLARRFDVSASSVQARRDREGWNRDGMLAGVIGAGVGAPFLAVGPSPPAEASPAEAEEVPVRDSAFGATMGGAKIGGAKIGGVGSGRAAAGGSSRNAAPSLAMQAPAFASADHAALVVAEAALGRALSLLAYGRGSEAVALLKAADAVGCYAEYVTHLRAEAAAQAAAPPPPCPPGEAT